MFSNINSIPPRMYPHSLLVSTCQLGLVVLVLFSYPLQVHPSRASLDKAIFPPTDDEDGIDDGILVGDHDSAEIPLLRFVVETSFILLTTFLISQSSGWVPSFGFSMDTEAYFLRYVRG